MEIPKIGRQLLSSEVKKILIDLMKSGMFDEKKRLPPEDEISESFNVSRTVIRDVYASLELEGFIIRKRGLGTLINYRVLRNKLRLDLESEFFEVIEEAGYSPSVIQVNVQESEVLPGVAQKLNVGADQRITCVKRTIAANGRAVIYCINYFSSSMMRKKISDESSYHLPIYDFFRDFCDEKVLFEISKVKAVLAQETVGEALQLSQGSPVLFLSGTAYNLEQKPLLWSEVYYLSDFFDFTIYRKKI